MLFTEAANRAYEHGGDREEARECDDRSGEYSPQRAGGIGGAVVRY